MLLTAGQQYCALIFKIGDRTALSNKENVIKQAHINLTVDTIGLCERENNEIDVLYEAMHDSIEMH